MIGVCVWLRVYWRSIVFVLFRFVFESSFIFGVGVCWCDFFFLLSFFVIILTMRGRGGLID